MSLTSKMILRDTLHLNVTLMKLEGPSRRCLHAASFKYPQLSSFVNKTQRSKLNVFQRSQALTWSVCGVQRHKSTEASSSTSELLPDIEQESLIPEPPSLPSYVDPVELPLNALGEPTLQSMGLGNNYPAGLYQQALEYLHVEGLSWVGAIAVVTIAIRLAMFPLNVLVQRNGVRTQNAAPKIAAINDKMHRAQQGGNTLLVMKYHQEMKDLMKKENCNPLKNFAVLFAQGPVFMTVFTGLRGMTNLPVESMKTEGIWWITNITVPDPVFLLPILTASTLFVIIEVGADSGVKLDESAKKIKKVIRVLPLITLVCIAKFPAALCFYWFTSNCFSLVLSVFFKIKPVRKFCKIPDRKIIQVTEQPGDVQPSKRGFMESFRQGMKMSNKVIEYESRKQVGGVTPKSDHRSKRARQPPQKTDQKQAE